ncbi:MAG: DUF885 domain-containing protein [Elusimicrobia bacterium]|nr:DUF885 domain-containing protein [Elusimicrobiota bacterium]
MLQEPKALSLLILTFVGFSLFTPQKLTAQDPFKAPMEASRFREIFGRYLARWASLNPEEATRLGIHQGDSKLTSRDDAAYKAGQDLVANTLAQLHEIKSNVLNPEDRIDYDLFEKKLLLDQFEYEHWDFRKTKPQMYLPLSSLFELFQKDYTNYQERAQNALSRLEQIPDILAQGMRHLDRPPKIWTEQAIEDCSGALTFLETDLPALFQPWLKLDPTQESRVKTAILKNGDAVRKYKSFLEKQILPRSDGDFAIGKRAYDFFLVHRHYLDLNPGSLSRLGKKAFRQTLKELRKTARKIDPESQTEDNHLWIEILDRAQKEHPQPDEVLSLYKKEIERAYQHFKKIDIVPIPPEKIRIIETPPFLRSVIPFAMYSPPYPLDDSTVGEFYITPLKEPLSTSIHEIQNTVIHEAIPGHHLQLSLAKKVSSLIRRTTASPLLSEGWALYCEELAYETGFYTSDLTRLLQLKMKLLRAARVILDVELQCGGMSFEEAVQFLEEKVHLPKSQARAEVLRYTQNPTQPMSYLVGMEQIKRLRKKFPDLKKFHNRLFKYGNLPLSLIEEEMEKTP